MEVADEDIHVGGALGQALQQDGVPMSALSDIVGVFLDCLSLVKSGKWVAGNGSQ